MADLYQAAVAAFPAGKDHGTGRSRGNRRLQRSTEVNTLVDCPLSVERIGALAERARDFIGRKRLRQRQRADDIAQQIPTNQARVKSDLNTLRPRIMSRWSNGYEWSSRSVTPIAEVRKQVVDVEASPLDHLLHCRNLDTSLFAQTVQHVAAGSPQIEQMHFETIEVPLRPIHTGWLSLIADPGDDHGRGGCAGFGTCGAICGRTAETYWCIRRGECRTGERDGGKKQKANHNRLIQPWHNRDARPAMTARRLRYRGAKPAVQE